MLNSIPVGRRSSGILSVIDRATRENDPTLLAQWFSDNPDVALDQGESEAVAAYLRDHCAPRRSTGRPRALSPQDAGWIMARMRWFYRTFEREDVEKYVVQMRTLAEKFGMSESAFEKLVREARRMPDARKK